MLPLLTIQLPSLTDLELGISATNPDPVNVNKHLQKCSNLKSLHLLARKPGFRSHLFSAVLCKMVHLSKLSLSNLVLVAPQSCEAFAQLSALNTLSLNECRVPTAQDWFALGEALHHTPVKSLRLEYVQCDVVAIKSLLQSLPLDHLMIRKDRWTEKTLRKSFKAFVRLFTKTTLNPKSFLIDYGDSGKNLNGVISCSVEPPIDFI